MRPCHSPRGSINFAGKISRYQISCTTSRLIEARATVLARLVRIPWARSRHSVYRRSRAISPVTGGGAFRISQIVGPDQIHIYDFLESRYGVVPEIQTAAFKHEQSKEIEGAWAIVKVEVIPIYLHSAARSIVMVAGTSSVRLEGHIRPHVVIPEYHSAAERGTVVGKSMARISSVEDEGIVLEEYELVAAPVSRIRPRSISKAVGVSWRARWLQSVPIRMFDSESIFVGASCVEQVMVHDPVQRPSVSMDDEVHYVRMVKVTMINTQGLCISGDIQHSNVFLG